MVTLSLLRSRYFLLVVILSALSSAFFITPASAQESCGSIITEADSTPIEDCSNPFGQNTDTIPLTLVIDGQTIVPDATLEITNELTESVKFLDMRFFGEFEFYKHEGLNYIQQDVTPTYQDDGPSEAQWQEALIAYFPPGTDISTFLQASLTGDSDHLTEEQVDLYYDFEDTFLAQYYQPQYPNIPLGMYTVVVLAGEPCLTYYAPRSIFGYLKDFFIKTAHAQCSNEIFISTLTFTLTQAAPEPTGASSVLFLPGIQASRLYIAQDGDGVDAGERVWEPGNNNDVRALEMDTAGNSLSSIYTKDIIDTVSTDILFGYTHKSGDVYKGFSQFLDDLRQDQKIKEWRPYAYDWRHDVFDVVQQGTVIDGFGNTKTLYETIVEMAEDSFSNKVTIVAHSNGGLLAKALMIQLRSLGREELVDHIIFIGTPHIGTPKAIGTILHGYDQEFGFGLVVDGEVARKVINNLPGAYSLLPSQKYLSMMSGQPLISTDTLDITSNYADYINYLVGDQSRSVINNIDIKVPAASNESLLSVAMDNHSEKLDTWIAPVNTRVSTIIGTGLPTMRGMYYKDLSEDICENGQITSLFCVTENFSSPMAILSKYGDGTVMAMSASEVGSDEKYYVDLKKISNLQVGTTYNHSNFTETSYVHNLMEELLLATTTTPNLPYVTTTAPQFIENYTIEQIASPVQIYATDGNGNVSGVVKNNNEWELRLEIPGSDYFEFAGVRYLITPTGIDTTTTLQGESYGGYSLIISEISSGDTQSIIHSYQNASVTPQMIATYSRENQEFSTVTTDYNGDAIIDKETTVDGESVAVTYDYLRQQIKVLELKKSQELLLIKLTLFAEKVAKIQHLQLAKKLEVAALRQLLDVLKLYKKKRLITSSESEALSETINKLIKI